METRDWFLYALRCADDTLYTGITTDLKRRVAEHNAGRGARYTAARRPAKFIGAYRFSDRSAAQRAEARFKRLSRTRKLQLITRELAFEGAAFYHDERVPDAARDSVCFCFRCGGLLKEIARSAGESAHHVCTACGRVHYHNAKPCAGALVVRDGRLLLVKRAIQPFLGYWDIPGGFLEEDEHPKAGAIREALEETGLEIQLTDLFGFYVDRYGDGGDYCLNIYFLAEVAGGQERPADDAAELAWFAPDELPEQIAFAHAREALDDWVQWIKAQPGDQEEI